MAEPLDSRVEEILQGGKPPLLSRVEKLLKEGGAGGGSVTPEQIAAAVEAYLDEHGVSVTETDPTVPEWAKQPQKPSYTADEVGALSEVITITFDDSSGPTVASMNSSEIFAAIDEKKIVNAKYMTALFNYAYRYSNTAVFFAITRTTLYELIIDSNSDTTVNYVDIQDRLVFDDSPTQGSANPITSGGVYEAISGKLDKSQGAANAGKFMVVGSDGDITAVTMSAWQGGSY